MDNKHYQAGIRAGRYKNSVFFQFVFYFLIAISVSGFYVWDRIQKHSSPLDEVRVHHHLGDGYTEHGWTIPAINNWKSLGGTTATYFVPCIRLNASGLCEAFYTHYPFGSFLLAKILFFTDEIIVARWAMVLLSCLLLAFIFTIFSCATSRGALVLSPLLIWFCSSYGSWIYIDNLFGHGLSNLMIGIGLSLFLMLSLREEKEPNLIEIQYYFFLLLIFSASLFSWEPMLPLCLMYLGILLCSKKSFLNKSILVFLLAITLISSLSLRLIQNTLVLGGFDAAISDWMQMASDRVIGEKHSLYQPFLTKIFSYFEYTIHGYKRLIGWSGIASIVLLCLYQIYLRNYKKLVLGSLVVFSLLSWNIFLIPHSTVHSFTHRPILWVVVFLFLEFFPRRWILINNKN
ncbi:MAG: hypothetical protein M9962_02310 [Oligoflexia bacterium]|nr:hypothetical protein [Oligoflexia bacterium]